MCVCVCGNSPFFENSSETFSVFIFTETVQTRHYWRNASRSFAAASGSELFLRKPSLTQKLGSATDHPMSGLCPSLPYETGGEASVVGNRRRLTGRRIIRPNALAVNYTVRKFCPARNVPGGTYVPNGATCVCKPCIPRDARTRCRSCFAHEETRQVVFIGIRRLSVAHAPARWFSRAIVVR